MMPNPLHITLTTNLSAVILNVHAVITTDVKSEF